jgi:protein TonB
VVAVRPFEIKDGVLRLPANPPAHPAILDDPPTAVSSIPGGGLLVGNGEGTGLPRFLTAGPPAQIRPIERPVAAQFTPSQPMRLPGGDVRLAHPIHGVEPRYPQPAIMARISGPVELEGIIGTDGRIRDLHALSGNPVLVPAALEAVRQWVYEPTLLNGKPVEVIAPITVIFRLTR